MSSLNVFHVDGILYRFLDKVMSFLFLNILWLISCLPIVTIFPATTAMFGVIRKWHREEDVMLLKQFFKLFKENFRQSFLVGIVWLGVAFVLYFNILASFHMPQLMKLSMLAIFFSFSLLFIITSIFICPVMVHYDMNMIELMKNVLLIAVTNLKVSLLVGITFFIAVLVTYIMPITLVIIWSFIAYCIYSLCNRTFQEIEAAIPV